MANRLGSCPGDTSSNLVFYKINLYMKNINRNAFIFLEKHFWSRLFKVLFVVIFSSFVICLFFGDIQKVFSFVGSREDAVFFSLLSLPEFFFGYCPTTSMESLEKAMLSLDNSLIKKEYLM